MTAGDSFALLGFPRTPLLEPEEVRERFRKLAPAAHPDHAGGDAPGFAELQEAAAQLTDPARRIRHFLELNGALPPRTDHVPPELQELFFEIAGVLREADEALAAQTGSSVARALALPRILGVREVCEGLRARIAEARVQAARVLREAEEAGVLAGLADRFAYLDRWDSQLATRVMRLSL